MTITRCLLVLLSALTLVHGAPKDRCCEPSPDCLDPCPQAEMNFQSDEMPAADGGLYSDQQQGAALQLEGVMQDCCPPGPGCNNPCQAQMDQMPPKGQQMAPPMEQPMASPMEQPMASPMEQPMAPPMEQPMATPMEQPMAPPMEQPMATPMEQQMAPPMEQPMATPMGMAPPMGLGGDCCQPVMDPTCQNPCQPAPPPPPQRTAYAPYPGEITFKLLQTWTDKYLDNTSPAFQILSGNVRKAIQAVLGPSAQVTNIYFREGYVPGNPATMPKVVAHAMVNGGSDDASRLQMAVNPGGTLGDGLKVYKDSFNAY